MNSTLITLEDYLLTSSLLSLSVLDFTRHHSNSDTFYARAASRDFLVISSFCCLLFLISSRLMPAIGLWTLKAFLLLRLLFSAAYKSFHLYFIHFSLLIVTSPSSSPSNTSGLLLLVHQGTGLLGEITDGLQNNARNK